MAEHSLEGLRIRCNIKGKFYGRVHNGVCSECGKEVRLVE
jgi:hypothetical protein